MGGPGRLAFIGLTLLLITNSVLNIKSNDLKVSRMKKSRWKMEGCNPQRKGCKLVSVS